MAAPSRPTARRSPSPRQGTHTVVYWSVDAAGNSEGQHTGYVNIDLTAPVTTRHDLQADNHSGWRNASQTVSLSPADGSGSGVAATYYTLDGGAQQTYGAPFAVSGVPAATPSSTGRSTRPATPRPHNTGYVNIDLTAPATDRHDLQANGNSGWQSTAQSVTLTPSDAPARAWQTTYYTVDGGAQQTYGAPFTVSAAGHAHHRLLVGRWRRQQRGASTPATSTST